MRLLASFLACALVSAPLSTDNQLARPRITGIAHVRFYASNLDRSREFYSKILGLPVGSASCQGITRPCFSVNDHQRIELVQATGAMPANLVAEIAFATDDASQMRRFLLAHGVSAGAITKEANGELRFELRDPERIPIAFVQRSRTAADRQSSSSQVSFHLIHAGSVVRERAAEDRFYKEIMGFRVYWHGGGDDTETDWVDMQAPEGTEWLEYMLNVPADADRETRGVMNHIALGVADIQAAQQQLLKNGWKPGEKPENGRDGKWQLNVYDPDATRVELMEFTPTQKPCCSAYAGPHPGPRE
jgi:catechol 2,3-dioxygenase-like lactoylglutathione lyase family enzyme